MQSNPMELMESNPVKTWIRLNSRRRRRARGVATCVITHWKQMTNVNVFTNLIHPHPKIAADFLASGQYWVD